MTHDSDAQGDLDVAARVVEELREWYERDVQPVADACGHARTFVSGPVRVCRDCGTTEQDEPVERPLVAQDAHPNPADAPAFAEQFARAAARRRLDEQADLAHHPVVRRANRRDPEVTVTTAWDVREGDHVVDSGPVVSVHRDPFARTVRIAAGQRVADLDANALVAVLRPA